MNNKLRMD